MSKDILLQPYVLLDDRPSVKVELLPIDIDSFLYNAFYNNGLLTPPPFPSISDILLAPSIPLSLLNSSVDRIESAVRELKTILARDV